MDAKRCARCHEEKPVAEFGPNRVRRDGLDEYCRACRKEANLVYYGNRKRGHSLENAFDIEF